MKLLPGSMLLVFGFLVGYNTGSAQGYKLGACKDAGPMQINECLEAIK